jgi:hypothetical protein
MVEPKSVLTAREVILWWEWRRLLYNAILLVIGLATIVGFEFIMSKAIPPGQDVQEPMDMVMAILAYAAIANISYTLGWTHELKERQSGSGRRAARAHGKQIFRIVLLVSSVVTSLPFWYACLYYFAGWGHKH